MKEVLIKLEGFCQGAYPVECLEELVKEDFYPELISLISNNKSNDAEKLAMKYFSAEYCLDNVESLNISGFKFIKTSSVNLNLPFISKEDNILIPTFKWIGAEFIIKGPIEIVKRWMKIENNKYSFNESLFDSWMEENGSDSLQDGCCYSLGKAWYDLEGFGENGCLINKSFLEGEVNT